MSLRITTIITLILMFGAGTLIAGPANDLARVEGLFREIEGAASSVQLDRAQSKLREAGTLLDKIYQKERTPAVLDKFATLRSWTEKIAILQKLEKARIQVNESLRRATDIGFTSKELLAIAERSILGAQRALAMPSPRTITAPSRAAPSSAGPLRHNELFVGPRRPSGSAVLRRTTVTKSALPQFSERNPVDTQDARATVNFAWTKYLESLGQDLLNTPPTPIAIASKPEEFKGKLLYLKNIDITLKGLTEKASWWFKSSTGTYVVLHFDQVVLGTFATTLVQGENVNFPARPVDVVTVIKGTKKIIGEKGVQVNAIALKVRALRTPMGFVSEDGAEGIRPVAAPPKGILAWLWWLVTRLFYLALILAGVLVLMIILLLIYFKIDEWRYERQFANEEWETGTTPPTTSTNLPEPPDHSCSSCGGCEHEEKEKVEDEVDDEANVEKESNEDVKENEK